MPRKDTLVGEGMQVITITTRRSSRGCSPVTSEVRQELRGRGVAGQD